MRSSGRGLGPNLAAGLTNPVAMFLLYYLVISPIGIAMRLAGSDRLRRRRDPDMRSYWIERGPPGPANVSMKRQF